jgi:hypothetical protein
MARWIQNIFRFRMERMMKTKKETKHNLNKWYRHGDVIIEEAALPEGCEEIKERNWLLQGEATGHAHRLESMENATLFQAPDKRVFLRVVKPVNLKHEEHHTRIIPPGTFEIRPTRETDHMERVTRRVAD